jgi:hypothetical protein
MALCRSEEGEPRDGRNQTFVLQVAVSECRRGFQDLLKVRPSSLFMLCGCISSSMASLMSRSMYLVLAERSFVSCSLIIWSWLTHTELLMFLTLTLDREKRLAS